MVGGIFAEFQMAFVAASVAVEFGLDFTEKDLGILCNRPFETCLYPELNLFNPKKSQFTNFDFDRFDSVCLLPFCLFEHRLNDGLGYGCFVHLLFGKVE